MAFDIEDDGVEEVDADARGEAVAQREECPCVCLPGLVSEPLGLLSTMQLAAEDPSRRDLLAGDGEVGSVPSL